jgi:hypothetical protein
MAPGNSNASEGESRRLLQSVGLVVCSCLSVVAATCLATRVFVGENVQLVYAQERINPNTAPVGSLIRLPGIGLTRARVIAAHRDAIRQKTDDVAFRCPGDLQQIKGIGPKTAEAIAGWLEFDSFALDRSTYPQGEPSSP